MELRTDEINPSDCYGATTLQIQFKIEAALDKTQTLIVYLDPLEKIDAAGAYMLYIASEKARENNKEIILFCKDNETVKKVFSYVGIPYAKKLYSTHYSTIWFAFR